MLQFAEIVDGRDAAKFESGVMSALLDAGWEIG